MTMIDEDVLRAALHQAADRVVLGAMTPFVPGGLVADGDRPHRSGRPHRHRSAPARRRWPVVLWGLAAVVMAVALVVWWPGTGQHPVVSGVKTLAPSASPTVAHGGPTGTARRLSGGPGLAPNRSVPEQATTSGAVGGPVTLPTTVPPVPSVGATPPRIEETGSVSVTVARSRVPVVLNRLSTLASSLGGFPASTDTRLGSGTISLEVPQSTFGSLVSAVRGLGRVDSLDTRAANVTGQYDDLSDQIAAAEASRQQYLTIMNGATSIGDILSVQAQLDTLDSQISQLEGQQQLLDSQTTYSTLTVTVTARTGPGHRPRPVARPSGLARSWHDAVRGFLDGVEGLIRVAGPLLFALLLLAAVAALGTLGWRSWRRRIL